MNGLCWCGCGRPAYRAGLWGSCYARWCLAGRTAQVPPPLGKGNDGRRPDRIEDYADLRSMGETRAGAAMRLGISERTAERYDAELRKQRQAVA